MVPELMDIPVCNNCVFDLNYCFMLQVCDELMEQRPSDYGGMKTYLKKTYDRVEK